MWKKKLLIVLSLLLFLFSKITLAAVATTSLPTNPDTGMKELRIPMEGKGSIAIYPQNNENQTIYFRIEVSQGKEFLVESLQEEYAIPPNTLSDDFKINLTFRAPRNATVGNKFRVEYKMTSTTNKEREEGMVGLAPPGFVKRFDIVIIGKEEKPSPPLYLYVLLGLGILMVILAIIWLITKNKGEEKR
jgi:hypothetical protein